MRHAILAMVRCIWGRGVTLAETLNEQVMRLLDERKYAEAEPLALQALEVSLKTNGPDHVDTATSLNNLATLYDNVNGWAEDLVEPLLKRALAIREKVLGPDHSASLATSRNLVFLYELLRKYDLAEPFYKRDLAIHEKVLGPDDEATATSLNNLASLYRNQGKYDLAEPLLKQALAIREKVFGPDHTTTAESLDNLASLYRNQGKYDLAESLLKRALARDEKVRGPDHEDTATALNNLGSLYKNQGKYDLAEPLYKRALAIYEKVCPDHEYTDEDIIINPAWFHDTPPDTATALKNLAKLYKKQGKYDLAEPFYKRALAIYEKVFPEDTGEDIILAWFHDTPPSTATALTNLASLCQTQEKYDLAEPLYERALAIRQEVLGPDHADTATALNNLAEFYNTQGKYDLSESLLKRALARNETLRERFLYPPFLGPD